METKFNLICPSDWNGQGCKREHVTMEGAGLKTLCGVELIPRRFDLGSASGDISSQTSMADLSERGMLNRNVCRRCLNSLSKLGKTYNVNFRPVTLVI